MVSKSNTISVSGKTIEISNPEKMMFPNDAITKRDIANYYCKIAETALPHFRDRALTMQRFPDGIGTEGFFQKRAADYFPNWIETAELPLESGTIYQPMANDAAALVYFANLGMITPHLALSRIERPGFPDQVVFDLDPAGSDFKQVQRAAELLFEHFKRRKIAAFVKTTGSRGLHVVIPLQPSRPFDPLRKAIRGFADRLAETYANDLTTEQRKEKRGQRLYLDTGRNAYGQTAVGAYGLRAKTGAPVATPLDWDEALATDMTPTKYSISNIFRRLGAKADPWARMDESAIFPKELEKALS